MQASSLDAKLTALKAWFADRESVLVTFSGGVDSTFLAKVAAETLKGKAAALTAVSPSLPQAELEETRSLASLIGIRHLVILSKELENPRYAANPLNRCYFCKSELFALAAAQAKQGGFACIVDGTHLDDLQEPRPGRQAAKEWGIRSPLVEIGFTKEEIRQASRRLGLPTWDKPAMACLASRFSAGTPITLERLGQVEACEMGLRRLGFRQLRARYHGEAVRVELEPTDLPQLIHPKRQTALAEVCHRAGFRRVLLDLAGYRG